MIDKREIEDFINGELARTDCFLTDVRVSPENDIVVEIDSPTSVDIDYCTELSRLFEEKFPREPEDYSLEIGSAGLTSPFKVRGQWEKNLGNPIDLLTKEGRKLTATLEALGEEDFEISYERKVKPEGAKRPVLERVTEKIPFADVRKAEYHLDF